MSSYEELKTRKAWDFAISPLKSLPMQAFMLYMSGGGVQIFSMGIVAMLLLSPFKNVSAINDGALSTYLPHPGFFPRRSCSHMRIFSGLCCASPSPSPPPHNVIKPLRRLRLARYRRPAPSRCLPFRCRSLRTWFATSSPSRSVFGSVGPWAYSQRAPATGWRSRRVGPPQRFRCSRRYCTVQQCNQSFTQS